jgi:hypothetical protein
MGVRINMHACELAARRVDRSFGWLAPPILFHLFFHPASCVQPASCQPVGPAVLRARDVRTYVRTSSLSFPWPRIDLVGDTARFLSFFSSYWWNTLVARSAASVTFFLLAPFLFFFPPSLISYTHACVHACMCTCVFPSQYSYQLHACN